MTNRSWYCRIVLALVLGVLAPNLYAQAPPQEVRGKVVSVTADEVVVESQGTTVRFGLAKDWQIAVVAPATLADIKAGSFVGTTNTDIEDGGLASEVHIFPPGSRMGEGQRVMNGPGGGTTRMTNGTVIAKPANAGASKPATRMTNGGVQQVQRKEGGESILELTFPGGSRRVRVPADALITSFTPADRSMLKPGILVSARAMPGSSGRPEVRILTTGPDGSAPAR